MLCTVPLVPWHCILQMQSQIICDQIEWFWDVGFNIQATWLDTQVNVFRVSLQVFGTEISAQT
jgi:hypothetical protein